MWCPLRFLLETVEDDKELPSVKTTKNPVDVSAILNSDFIQASRSFNMFEELVWDSFRYRYNAR